MPLIERLKEYAREEALMAASTVAEIKPTQKEPVGLSGFPRQTRLARKRLRARTYVRRSAPKQRPSGLSPLDYMLSVMRDEKADAHRRDGMAKAAAPFVHPRMAPIDGSKRSSEAEMPLIERLKEYAREDAIKGASNVVEIKPTQKERVELSEFPAIEF